MTHNDEVAAAGDRIVGMRDGKVVDEQEGGAGAAEIAQASAST